MIVILGLGSAERRSLSDFYAFIWIFLSTFSSCSADIFGYIRTIYEHYKNSGNTRTFRGRFLGVFFFIIFRLADRQTAYHYRVLGGFGVSLHISLASEDSCSFLPMRYPQISTRRCVGRSGISFWSFFGGGPTTGYTGREQT